MRPDSYAAITWGNWLIMSWVLARHRRDARQPRQNQHLFRARNQFERIVIVVLALCATVAILTTIGIVFSVFYETLRFFFDPTLTGRPTVTEFLFGTEWNPQAALRADQGEIKTAFGFVPLLTGTLLITVIALLVAGPLGLLFCNLSCPSTPARVSARWPSPSSKSWPASPRWCSASSPP